MGKLKRRVKKLATKLGIIEPEGIMSDKEIAHDKETYTKLNTDSRFILDEQYDYICKHDKYAENGMLDSGYFVQDIWGARKVGKNKPKLHCDVGSSVAGFIAHLLAQHHKILLLDIRPMSNVLNTPFLNANENGNKNNNGGGGVTYLQTNATHLKELRDESIESLSALCSVEHFGLGRYGDPIEPDAWQKALKAFQRVLQKDGKLYISVPVAPKDKLCFNAHRVYNPNTIIETLDSMELIEFGYIDGFDVCYGTCKNGSLSQAFIESIPTFHNNGVTGLFEFVKK